MRICVSSKIHLRTRAFLFLTLVGTLSVVIGDGTPQHTIRGNYHNHNDSQNVENLSNFNMKGRGLNNDIMLREGQFAPLSCNANLTVMKDCSSNITLSSILESTPGGSEVLIECGTCAMVDVTDGSTLNFDSGLNIEGMLYFPSTAKVTLQLDHMFVQGTLKMDAPLVGNTVTFFMTGTENKILYPHYENANACKSTNDCSMGKRAIAVAGGTLDISGISGDKPCPAWTHLSIPSSDFSAIGIGQDAAECWAEIIDSTSTEATAEILITNSEVIHGWKEHHVYEVSSIDVGSGILHLTNPIEGNPVTTEINELYAAEVALLNRRIIFDSIMDGTDNLHGGHLIINRTPNVAQKLEGVEIRNFGQQGNIGTYPIHFHMSDSVTGSLVRKNVIRQSNQRCVVIHGSHEVMIENNVAYNTHGHCYILEDGAETENTFKDNLGAMTHNQKNGIGSTDHKAATFWITNPKNHFIGNTAAGSQFSGFWFELLPIRGESKTLDDNIGIDPKTLDMYTFTNNTSHSSYEFGLNTYEIGYRGSGTMINTKLYKNKVGLFVHGTSGVTFKDGLIADSRSIGMLNFDNFSPGNTMENFRIIGTSAMYRDTVCPQSIGLMFSLNNRDEQLVLRNTTFEGFSYNNSLSCTKNSEYMALILKEDFHEYPYDMPVFESDVTFDSIEDVFDISHDFSPPSNPWNVFLEDSDGSMNPTGLPGFFVQDAPRMTAFTEDGACSRVNRTNSFAQFCKETCMRRVFINTGCCEEKHVTGQLDADYSLAVISMNVPTKYHEFTKYTYSAGNWKKNFKFDIVLPGGEYALQFKNPNGDIEWPSEVDITFDELLPACDGYVTESSFYKFEPLQ